MTTDDHSGGAVVPTAPSTDVPTSPEDNQGSTASQVPTATIDPNKPSDESAPTALPTNPATSPQEQQEAVEHEHPAVVTREAEKTKAEEREIKGEKPLGTVIHGVEDDRLWAMLRRFDVQITHVLHPARGLPPAEPDLRPSTLPNLPSHTDILRSNLERVVAAIGPSALRGSREVQRLMSWAPEERWRTGSYCTVYFISWIFGYTMATVFIFLSIVVCFPSTRRWLFPPAAPAPFTPPSATDPTNKKGDESLLGSVDGKTVHRSKAEQAEEQAFEATSVLKAYTTRLLWDGRKKGKSAGNANVGEKDEYESSSSSDELGEVQDKPQGEESADVAVGGENITLDKPLNDKEKKRLAQREAKRKRDKMVSKMTKATEDGLGAFADTMERLTNALSPPGPYPDSFARFKIAGAFLIPPALLLTFVPAWVFGRAATFGLGFGLWGQPLIIKGINLFIEKVPNWQDYLDIRNSILSRVPTDAQLTLHLLRVTEALGKPLPRPPRAPLEGTPKEAIKDTTPAAVTADDDAALAEAQEEGGATAVAAKAKHKTKSQIASVFKSAGKHMAGFRGDVSVDGARKQFGDKVDQVLFRGHVKDSNSIESYPARLDGTSGQIVIDTPKDGASVPTISFVPTSGGKAHFTRPIDDIVEINKSHVSMSRMALGWASGADVEGLGLSIRFKTGVQQARDFAAGPNAKKEEGETMHFSRVSRREGLFVRLVSAGRQRWETL